MDTAHHFDDLLTHRDRAVEDGHCPVTTPPNGSYPMTVQLGAGIKDYECVVWWALRGDRLCIEAIDYDGDDGAEGLDPNGTALERALYPRLAAEALSRRDDILARWRDQQ